MRHKALRSGAELPPFVVEGWCGSEFTLCYLLLFCRNALAGELEPGKAVSLKIELPFGSPRTISVSCTAARWILRPGTITKYRTHIISIVIDLPICNCYFVTSIPIHTEVSSTGQRLIGILRKP